jgi:nicotinate-nucleotide adenylyltransferase
MSSGSENPAPRLGVFGGTFDPPHLGHLILAECAADRLGLSRVLFVPAATPPHKHAQNVRESADHRVAMVERAIAGNPRFALSRVDLDRPGPHYSVDMLRLLRAEHPGTTLIFLIGSDSLRDLPRWYHPHELIQEAVLGVMLRPDADPDVDTLEQQIPGLRARLRWISAPRIEIASHLLAQQIAARHSVRYQVPDAVLDYIQKFGLYQEHKA